MNSAKIKTIQREMKVLSTALREEFGLSSKEPVNIDAIIARKVIIASFKPLEDSFSGMSVRLASKDGVEHLFMLINTAQSIGKQRFTACHELYHLLYQDKFELSANNAGLFDQADEEEYRADVFAANLLIPESGLDALIPANEISKDKISLETILLLEHTFLCSRSTLLRTLKERQLISSEKYNTYCCNVMRGAVEYGYDLSLYKPNNTVALMGDYNIKARRLLDSGKISLARYQELLDAMELDREVSDDGE